MKKFLGIILSVLLIFSMNLSYAFAEAGATDSVECPSKNGVSFNKI